ncbi:hypothetical protein HAX54_009277 [Datura stramonium]|uniref:Uncharacterized protein n=1 Tax=Datura stramonium TaxID=4076 RepID=A0ABS8RW68_DATST|nr:hypothetical protein [Datura stramonium]
MRRLASEASRGGNNAQPPRPPRADAQHPRNAGPPPPQHLATVSTPEKNDPLWTTGLGDSELCEVLPQLIQVMHLSLTAASTGYARRIPESALSYYAAVCTTYPGVSPLLAYYLAGFGNTRVPSGRDIKFRLADRPNYIASGNVSGWFGRVTAETQLLYASYPCLVVHAARVLVDVNPAEYARHWDFPQDISPDIVGALRPSSACLGYAPRARLSQQ